jgi:hypothetical protein
VGLANRRFRPLSHLSVLYYQRFTKAAPDRVELHVDYSRPFFQSCRREQVKRLAAAGSTKIPDLVLLDEFGIYCERVKPQ